MAGVSVGVGVVELGAVDAGGFATLGIDIVPVPLP